MICCIIFFRSFNYSITVSDGVHSDNATLTVNVLDVNDNPPVFQDTSYTFHLLENTQVPAPAIGSLVATDIDSGSNKEVSSLWLLSLSMCITYCAPCDMCIYISRVSMQATL